MSDADDNVIEQLQAKRDRPRRQPPARRAARTAPSPPEAGTDARDVGEDRTQLDSTSAGLPEPPMTLPVASQTPLRLAADEPTTNYAVRVRRSLDDLAAWRLAELRRENVRVSKVELTEMLLWELADADIEDIIARLGYFRSHAPR
jgi:hypothetical protein